MRTIKFILFLVLIAMITPVYAQFSEFKGDTIELDLEGYTEGQIQWQFSSDNIHWVDIQKGTNQKLIYIADQSGYFRAKVNTCNLEHFSNSSAAFKIYPNLDAIKICRWKDDANTCVSFSFDDGMNSQKRISEILDHYGYKGSFFIIPTTLNQPGYLKTDSLKNIQKRGHEIGNHTYSHLDFFDLDSTAIDNQIQKAQEIINNLLGIKCVSFAEPRHHNTQLSTRLALKYDLFVRNYSQYPDIHRVLQDYFTTTTMADFTTSLKKAITSHNLMEMRGHGIDKNGYLPVTKSFFIQTLDSIKKYTNSGDVWVATVKDGAQYENLYHEMALKKSLSKDTLLLNLENYNINKYKDLDTSPISIEIPDAIFTKLTCLDESVIAKKIHNKVILTTDLKKKTSIRFLIKDL